MHKPRIDVTEILASIVRDERVALRYDEHVIGDLRRIIFQLEEHERNHPTPHRAIHGRFEGVHYVNPVTGEITVADQTVPVSTALTGKFVFTDSTGATVTGPMGTIAADNSAVTDARLSADGQSYNFTSAASGDVTLTWTDPAGAVPSFSQTFTDQVVAATITGAFGSASPGTTA